MPFSRIQPLLHLLVICLLAFVLRHTAWDWDEMQHLHPDERHLSMVTQVLDHEGDWFNTHTSGFNPYNRGVNSYVYGLLPIRIVHGLTVARGEQDLREIARVGRLCSALWSTGTVALLFLFAWRLVSARFASLSGLLMSLTVFSIQQAHFYTVDSAGVFFCTLCCGLGLLALKENRCLLILPAGASVGLAMACRVNLGLLGFWVIALSAALAWKRRDNRPLLALAGGGLLAMLLFRICQPNAFLSTGFLPQGLNPQWTRDVEQVRAIGDGLLEVPYTLQWVGRIPWLYALQQIVVWGMGLPLGLLAVCGSLVLLWQQRPQLWRWPALLVLWPLMLIAYHGGIFLHTMRYFLPAYPMLILGGLLVLRSVQNRELRRILHGLVLFPTLLYALAFINMYRQPHPRLEASRWLLDQLAAGGSVGSEHWDDALPLYLPGSEAEHAGIRFDQLEVYQPESPEKIRRLLQQIEQADYLVLSSTRASHTIPRMPLRYPVMTRFYQRLAEGPDRSGLKEVARFQRRPNLGGWQLDTLHAEEALRVYDHPLVRIYEKTPVFDAAVVEEILTEGIDFTAIPQLPYTEANRNNRGMFNPRAWQKRQTNEPWQRQFSPKSLGNRAPVLVWGLVLWLLGPLSFPFAFHLFPSLRDRGAALSRLLGLLMVSTLAWWPAAIGLLPFGKSLLAASMLLGSGSALLLSMQWEHFRDWLTKNVRRLLWSEAVIWTVFAFFLILRFLQPDLWHPWAGGEKPMDFAYLNATAQTPYFPPPNPWFSGAFINYYYYGFVLFASLIRMTGISPDLAYNLALPTCALFIAGGAVSLSMIFFPAFRSRPGWRGWKAASMLTVLLTLFVGNLGQLREFMKPGPLPYLRDVYWNISRIIRVPDGVAPPITEFPLFSLLYGDLHAHLMALPVSMLCLLSSWQLFRRFHPARVAVTAALLGALQVINAWDLPIQLLIFLYCLFASAFPLRGQWQKLIARTGWALGGLLILKLSFAPFHWYYQAYPASLKFWEGPRSSLIDLFLAHGLFLIALNNGLLVLRTAKALRKAPLRSRLLPTLLIFGCLFTIVILEFVMLEGDAGRMNMVFKFYYQIWWLLAAVSVPVIIAALQIRSPLYKLLCGFLLGLSLLYTLTAIPAKIKERFWDIDYRGLDGLAYMQQAEWHSEAGWIPLTGDRQIIAWLRREVPPFSIILEAHRPLYQWGGRISWHTGHAAVLGWDWHMQQQRPWPGADLEIARRRLDIQDFYLHGNPDILRRYGVEYVIVGQLEEITYGPGVVERIATIPGLEQVFSADDAYIFKFVEEESPAF